MLGSRGSPLGHSGQREMAILGRCMPSDVDGVCMCVCLGGQGQECGDVCWGVGPG